MTRGPGAVLAVLLAAALFGTTGTAQALGPVDATPLGVGAALVVQGSMVPTDASGGRLRPSPPTPEEQP